jgi:hypothetical protein
MKKHPFVSSSNPLFVMSMILGTSVIVTFLFANGVGSPLPRVGNWSNTVPSLVKNIPNPLTNTSPVPVGLTQQAQQITDKSMGVADRVVNTVDTAAKTADRVVEFGSNALDQLLPAKTPMPSNVASGATSNSAATSANSK